MRDFTRKLMDIWSKEGDQAAYDLAPELLIEIEAEQEKLKNEASAIRAFGRVLENTAGVIARSTETDPELDVVEARARPRLILEAALEVWESQNSEWPPRSDPQLVKGEDVLEQLRTKGLDLGVKQPLAVIGTILNGADEFTKLARNTFEYTPPPPPAVLPPSPPPESAEDLPW